MIGCDPSQFAGPVWMVCVWGSNEPGCHYMCARCALEYIKRPQLGVSVYDPKGRRYPERPDPCGEYKPKPKSKSKRNRSSSP